MQPNTRTSHLFITNNFSFITLKKELDNYTSTLKFQILNTDVFGLVTLSTIPVQISIFILIRRDNLIDDPVQ